MSKKTKILSNFGMFLGVMVLVLCGALSDALAAGASSVSVYAEGAYTDTDLAVYVYADIPAPMALISMGVRVCYDSTKLAVTSMAKNEHVWYFGSPSHKYPYMDPEDTGSCVVIVGGKLDTGDPDAGVTGDRVLLGKIRFNRLDSGDPGSTPEDYFGISLEVGKGGTYANFVDTDGNVLDDGVTFSAIVRERGDANGDGSINVSDILRVKSLLGTDDAPVFVDCNGDERIDVQDILCVKSKL